MATSQHEKAKTGPKGKADEVRKLYNLGLTPREIAKMLDLSTQGVYWHLKNLKLPVPSKRDVEGQQ